ncbi:hypothetical protein KC845_02895 [Candidatus Kaiserbacteria bacterium]|nr:hypothetical protein [Candidatus Kaiserbacteria bacterium]
MRYRPIEAYRIFPLIAWSVVIAFALFTYYLVTELQKELVRLEIQNIAYEQSIQNNLPSNLN